MSEISRLISMDLKLNEDDIKHTIEISDYLYKEYYIEKTDGSKRRILQPSPKLKVLQYWCVSTIFSGFPISTSAYAYIQGKSIKKHAQQHAGNHFILHLDIRNFFESITKTQFERLLEDNKELIFSKGIDLLDAKYALSKICLYKNFMSIGAVSSPIISNAILYKFDLSLQGFARNHHLTYTRYADDIYLSSSSYIDKAVIDYIKDLLITDGFILNNKKSYFMSAKSRQHVTGLIITNDSRISIGLSQKKKIKHMVYEKMVKHIGDSNVILGYLSYVKDVEPSFYNHIMIKYSKYGDIKEILSH